MTLSLKTFSKISLAMLVLVSAAFFVVPAKEEAQAQSRRALSLCVNSSTGSLAKPSPTNTCPTGSVMQSNFPVAAGGVCKFRNDSTGSWEVLPPIFENNKYQINATGTKCINPEPYADFISFNAIQQYNPGGTTTPGTNPGTTPGTNPGGGTTTTPPTTNPGGGTNTNTGGCENGFHKVGPLCVPTSPFNNGDAIAGETTVGGLAARIVRILLYFAGIVAVIMAIVGGYYVMTAGGNEAQATSGRKTLTNAIIGLAIIILSYIIIQAVISFVT